MVVNIDVLPSRCGFNKEVEMIPRERLCILNTPEVCMLSIGQLPFPKIGADSVEYTLPERLFLGQWLVPKGTIVKLKQTQNFGLVFLPVQCPDQRGFIIPRRFFQV